MTERRRFSIAERSALYLAADGKCTECGAELGPAWHADHINPWSRGGPTDVTNGQALCPGCNLRKGAKVEDLRKWQSGALAKLLGTNADFLAVATPGAGKTRFALTAARRLIDLGEVRRVIVVVPTSHLRRQWAEAAVPFGIQIDHTFTNRVSALAGDVHGVTITYATVAAQPLLWRKVSTDVPTLVILDEVHHGADELAWGEALKEAFAPASRRLLLSGTPFRSDRSAIPFVTYGTDRNCVASWNYDYGAALQDHDVVRPIEFLALDGDVRWRDAGTVVQATLAEAEDDETLRNALASALSPDGDWITSVLRQADDELNRHRLDVPDAGGLVVASNQYDADRYAAHLDVISGEHPVVATSDKPDASDRITRYAEGSTKWIVAVQMVSEGVDIPRLAVGVYGTRTRTEMFFRQLVGRFVRMRGPGDETTATLLIPSIQPLLRYAHAIEQTVLRALEEDDERIRDERKIAEPSLRLDLVEPLDSSVATHHSTILAGDSFTDDELQRAQELAQAAGMPGSVTAAQMARALRIAGAGRVVGTATVAVPPEIARPIADEKKARRRLLKRKVGQYHRLTDTPFWNIHGDLNRACGDTADTATVETLDRRLSIIDGWLEGM